MRQYLEALAAHKPKRGRKRTAASINARLAKIAAELLEADPLNRVHLVQEQFDLRAELESRQDPADLTALEEAFVKAAGKYSQRKKISYAAWRAVGIDVGVLRRAGIHRSKA